jgi:sec-independent protein translocase protein TatA
MLAEIFGMDGAIVAVIAFAVLFGAKKIPEMARSIGRAQGEFKKGLKDGATADEPDEPQADESDKTSSEGPQGKGEPS